MKIIVDLFNQHSGNLTELKRLALSAFLNGADAAKIQILNSQRIWGDDTRKYMEMTFGQVKEFKDYCDQIGVEFLATVFDEEKLEWLDELNVKSYKIASVTALKDKELCERILNKNKPTVVSLGMYTPDVFPFGFNNNIKYLHCISKYPTFLYDKELKTMPKSFTKSDGYYGYSDHSVGMAAATMAYFRGANVLEKHYTHNINAQNNCEKAHMCSFTPESLRQFKNLIQDLKIING
jgi:N-acetylneuraminate synthase/N,N'-diacetyllegionaminate synthase